ncbi:putative thiamine-monophosphate kinase [Mycobacterium xenopi 4042]|uniref:Putative thiamine-monophosphate kinase n=1 Tax=Mycobacterium xenopi 4042 TaxID=1299334 RepID=X7Z3Q0_MYCXE|nr:putative thiamine-monophosphate kinase [Mycobacterium xenopi 4042]
MGAAPTAFVVGLGAPPKPSPHVSASSPMPCGTRRTDRAGIVGGDLVNCPQWVVAVTVLAIWPGCAGAASRSPPGLGDRRRRRVGIFSCRIFLVAQRN